MGSLGLIFPYTDIVEVKVGGQQDLGEKSRGLVITRLNEKLLGYSC